MQNNNNQNNWFIYSCVHDNYAQAGILIFKFVCKTINEVKSFRDLLDDIHNKNPT